MLTPEVVASRFPRRCLIGKKKNYLVAVLECYTRRGWSVGFGGAARSNSNIWLADGQRARRSDLILQSLYRPLNRTGDNSVLRTVCRMSL